MLGCERTVRTCSLCLPLFQDECSLTSTNGVDTASCGGTLMPLRVRCARTEERLSRSVHYVCFLFIFTRLFQDVLRLHVLCSFCGCLSYIWSEYHTRILACCCFFTTMHALCFDHLVFGVSDCHFHICTLFISAFPRSLELRWRVEEYHKPFPPWKKTLLFLKRVLCFPVLLFSLLGCQNAIRK